MLYVHRSNRMEVLADALARVTAPPLAEVLSSDTVIVQSKGMERWLKLELSRRAGVCANMAFPFPRTAVESLFEEVLAEPASPAFTREALTWSIAAILPRLEARSGFEPVRDYLASAGRAALFELAHRIAYVFDQYGVYRPEWLLGWERNETRDWQGALWKELVHRHGSGHVAARAERFFEAVRAGSAEAKLPERLCVFGVSSLPPLYLRILSAVSALRAVHLFCLAPSRHYTGDLPRRPDPTLDAPGNALVASLGTIAGDFSHVLEELADYEDRSVFVDPGTSTVLHTLQSDILWLRDRGGPGGPGVLAVDRSDESVQIHVCHSPMREVEVLRDQLLAAFDADPSLAPHDVVVMAPDIERYAPLIDAVFGLKPDEAGHLPYRIADRTARTENELAKALVEVLQVLPGRMKASEVLDLLGLAPIRRRFGIEAEELPEVLRLVHDLRIRWGVDAAHREKYDQPAADENTWRFGLRRMLLGYAMPTEGRATLHGLLPFDDLEGDTADLAGRLSEFAESLFACRTWVESPKPATQWTEVLHRITERLLQSAEPGDGEDRLLREAIASLAEQARAAEHTEPIDIQVVANLLIERFTEERLAHDFLAGGITFCALLPMRSVPFRVVCLLGMNDAEFPRADRTPSFDKIAEAPRVGDRSIREEDRYLFLEALLSARDRFLVTFVGRGIHDNAEFPPSVTVADLIDVMSSAFRLVDGSRSGQLSFGFDPAQSNDGPAVPTLTAHPLQAFSPRYFDGRTPRLFSYSATNADGAQALVRPKRDAEPFAQGTLAAADAEEPVGVEALARFFENPARALVQGQLGVYLEDEILVIEDREPLEWDPLARFEAGSVLFRRLLEDPTASDVMEHLAHLGLLPLGTPGRAAALSLLPEVEGIVDEARRWLGSGRLDPVDVEVRSGPVTLSGVLGPLYEKGLVRAQFTRVRPKTELGMWVRHLVLQRAAGAGAPRTSVLIGREPAAGHGAVCRRIFPPLPEAAAEAALADLVQLYRLGHRAPLPLFPQTSKHFVETLARNREKPDAWQRALDSARRNFASGAGSDAEDPYVQRLFAGTDPFTSSPTPAPRRKAAPDFAELAQRVFGPMLEALANGANP